ARPGAPEGECTAQVSAPTQAEPALRSSVTGSNGGHESRLIVNARARLHRDCRATDEEGDPTRYRQAVGARNGAADRWPARLTGVAIYGNLRQIDYGCRLTVDPLWQHVFKPRACVRHRRGWIHGFPALSLSLTLNQLHCDTGILIEQSYGADTIRHLEIRAFRRNRDQRFGPRTALQVHLQHTVWSSVFI